jgi:hypothetical protein
MDNKNMIPGKLYKLTSDCYFIRCLNWNDFHMKKNSVLMLLKFPGFEESDMKFLYNNETFIIHSDFISLFEEVVLF